MKLYNIVTWDMKRPKSLASMQILQRKKTFLNTAQGVLMYITASQVLRF